MHDIIANFLVWVIYVLIAILLVQRRWEAKGMEYSVTKVPEGRVFSFALGIYAGKVRIVHRPSCVVPWFVRHVDGWEIVFPMAYSDEEVDAFLLCNDPPHSRNTPHSKDLEVYRQVMIYGNEELSCVAGRICKLP